MSKHYVVHLKLTDYRMGTVIENFKNYLKPRVQESVVTRQLPGYLGDGSSAPT